MSHITNIDQTMIIPKSGLLALLNAVKTWCPTMELVQGQSHYRTWKDDHNGNLVGDWPLPKGWTANQIGEGAAHVIRVTDNRLVELGCSRTSKQAPYEIGVVPVKVERDANGKVLSAVYDATSEEYVLLADWYASGNGVLREKGLGVRKKDAEGKESAFGDLYMFYQMEQKRLDAERVGDVMEFEVQKDGTYIGKVDTVQRLGV